MLLGGLVAARGHLADALWRVARYIGEALGWGADGFTIEHLEIALFSMLVAAAVAVMGSSGGTRAVVQRLEALASGRRGAMVTSWLTGMVVFFDDYANCLVVGNAMAPVCDRNGVSREKLAYIVDSTAAPIASLAVVSTWVGYEVTLIGAQLPPSGPSAFAVFLASLPYRFYAIVTLVFVGSIAISGRDFGPMRLAEQHAQRAAAPDDDRTDASPWLAVVPVGLLLAGTLGWLGWDGWRALDPAGRDAVQGALAGGLGPVDAIDAFATLLGGANPFHGMLLGSSLALLAAVVGAGLADRTSLPAVPGVAWAGAREVAGALVVLFLAWALSAAMQDTGAAAALATAIDGRLPVWALPATTFTLAAAIAFATGTSFGTMGILLPIALPLALALSPEPGPILYGTTAAVLAGACMGDHMSPISDTTVLSSVGAGVDLMAHVRTQAPYALTTGAIAALVGYLPIGLGVPVWLALFVSCLAAIVTVRLVGRSLERPEAG